MMGLLSLWMRGGMVGAGGKQQCNPATSVALQVWRIIVQTDNSASSQTQRQHRRTGNERNAWKINTASLSLLYLLLSSSQSFPCSAQWETMSRQLAKASRHCRSIKANSLKTRWLNNPNAFCVSDCICLSAALRLMWPLQTVRHLRVSKGEALFVSESCAQVFFSPYWDSYWLCRSVCFTVWALECLCLPSEE